MFIAGSTTLCIVAASEILWRRNRVSSEFIRKFIHLSVGCFVALWPWFLSWHQIELSAVIFVLAMAAIGLIKPLSRLLSVSDSSKTLNRHTVGEFFYTLGFLSVSFITHDRYIFMTALLHLAISDTLAAFVGLTFKKHNIYYKVFGSKKSLCGSLTFMLSSIVLVAIYISLSHSNWSVIFYVPVTATVLENFGLYGSDNILVPFGVALLL